MFVMQLSLNPINTRGRRCRDRMNLRLPVQSVPIIFNVVGSNPAHGEVYSIQLHVIKCVSDSQHAVVFSGYCGFLLQ
jgi:hypothetical protein